MKNSLINPLETRDSFSTFITELGKVCQEENLDIRTLGHQKRLHAVSKALGYTNWHHLKSLLDKKEFIETMETYYGMSDKYADAAWNTLHSSAIDGGQPAKTAAINYCLRFNISPLTLGRMKGFNRFGEIIKGILLEHMPPSDIDEFSKLFSALVYKVAGPNFTSKEINEKGIIEQVNYLNSCGNFDSVLRLIEDSDYDIKITQLVRSLI